MLLASGQRSQRRWLVRGPGTGGRAVSDEDPAAVFRGDAAVALPELYEFLEAEGYKCAIRLKANAVLQDRIADLLRRPVGRPPKYVRRLYASLGYQAGSWDRKRWVVAKVEWHPGEPFPRVEFIVTNLTRPAARVVAFYNQRGSAEQRIKVGQDRGEVDLPVLPRKESQRGPAPASRPSLQPVQFHAHPRPARRGGRLVIDHHPGEVGEDRRQGRRARPLCRLPDGRSGGARRPVRAWPRPDRQPPAARTSAMLTRRDARVSRQTGEMRLPCWPMRRNRFAADGQADRRRENTGHVALGGPVGLAIGQDPGNNRLNWRPAKPPYGKSRLPYNEPGKLNAVDAGVRVSPCAESRMSTPMCAIQPAFRRTLIANAEGLAFALGLIARSANAWKWAVLAADMLVTTALVLYVNDAAAPRRWKSEAEQLGSN